MNKQIRTCDAYARTKQKKNRQLSQEIQKIKINSSLPTELSISKLNIAINKKHMKCIENKRYSKTNKQKVKFKVTENNGKSATI